MFVVTVTMTTGDREVFFSERRRGSRVLKGIFWDFFCVVTATIDTRVRRVASVTLWEKLDLTFDCEARALIQGNLSLEKSKI